MDALDGFLERLALQRFRQPRHAGITRGLDQLHGAVVNALEQQNPDFIFGERELGRMVIVHDRSVLQQVTN